MEEAKSLESAESRWPRSLNPSELARVGLDRVLRLNRDLVLAHVARMRRSRPDAPPAEVIKALEKQLVAAVAALGGGAGAAAAVPGVGTAGGLLINVAEVGSFFEAAALFTFAVAEVHGVHVEDLERRRTLLMSVLLGSQGTSVVEKVAAHTGKYWGKGLAKAIPMTAINAANKVLGPRFVTRFGTSQGVLVLGRELPFGFGALIGAGGNVALAALAIGGARRAFGPAPAEWPSDDVKVG